MKVAPDIEHPKIAAIVMIAEIPFMCVGFLAGIVIIGIIAGFKATAKLIEWI